MPYQGRLPYNYKSPYNTTLDQGTQTVPSLAFLGDTNNGLFSPATDNVAITTNGSEKLRVTDTGSVGIGTTNPSEKLEVNGRTVLTTGIGPFYGLKVKDYSNTTGVYVGSVSGGSAWYIGDSYYYNSNLWRTDKTHASSINFINGTLEFYTNTGLTAGVDYTPSRKMILDSSGNLLIATSSVTGTASQPLQVTGGAYVSGSVGIGTTNPSYKFDILDTDTDVVRFRGTNSGVRFQSNSTTMDIVSHNGSDSNTRNLLIRQYGASTGILLDTNNNVGIGTTNPGYKLDVHGSAAFTTGVFFHPSGVVKAAINVAQTANQGVIGTAVDDTYQWTSGGKIIWSTDNGVTPNLVLNSTGSVGIGTTNPSASLEIKKDVGSQIVNLLKLTNSSTAGNPGQSIVFQGYYNSAVISAFQTPTFSLGGNLQLQTYNASNTLNTGILLNRDGNVGIGTTNPADKLDVNGNILPTTDATYNLGSSTKRWANIYSADLQLSNEGSSNDVDGTWGQYTIQEGENDLFLLNRRNGKKYKFVLQEVN